MTEKNNFRIKKKKEEKITVIEEDKYRSPFILFFLTNGRLIFNICLLLALSLILITGSYIINNLKESKIVTYESDGTIITFDGTNQTNLDNNTPITDEYANKIFEKEIDPLAAYKKGVVIKLKEIKLRDETIIYYSDKTALVKYNDGKYLKVYPVNNDYGINEKGQIKNNAITKELTGKYKKDNGLEIELLYLSDGSIEVTKNNMTFLVRNGDITSLENTFYTNLSKIEILTQKDDNRLIFSNNTIKENNYIIVNGKKYEVEYEKVYNDIKIIYYTNGYGEVINGDLDIIVEKSEHINYNVNDDTLIIIDEKQEKEIKIENLLDIKTITLNNKSKEDANYMIVLEETSNYEKHNVTNILPNNFIHYTLSVDGKKLEDRKLDNNITETEKTKPLNIENNTYLIYEGSLKKSSVSEVKLGLWIDYETITNEYMDATFIGTVKVYVESK